MIKLYPFILFLFLGHLVAGQKLIGNITDENNLPLPGATIRIQDKIAITDIYGRYTVLDLNAGKSTIQITYIGYSTFSDAIDIKAGLNLFSKALNTGEVNAKEVVIFGDRLKGQAKALNTQKTNANITNVVSADQIGRFPDANIGDALKRIPGITVQNDQGEARDIIIRGMAPQLNSVMLNGERLPSAEGDNRRVQLDLIPADMIQTIQVNKAILPDMDADAIGGAVNLITRTAPSDFRLSTTLGSGINLLSQKPIYNGAFVLGDRIFNNKLGFILSGSYNDHNFGSDNVEAVWVNGPNGAVIDEFDIRKYLVRRVRRSTSLNLDYTINLNHNIGFSAMYNWRDDWENRFRMRVSRLEDAFEGGNFTDLGAGKYQTNRARVEFQTKGGIDNDRVRNARLEDQRVWNYTINGKHLFNKLSATWNVTYAQASEERPNERYLSFRQSRQDVTLDVSNPRLPIALLSNPANNFNIGLNELTEQYQYTFDQDLNARLDFQLPYATNGILKFGGRLRSKLKDRDIEFFEYSEINPTFSKLGDVTNADYSDPNYLAGPQYAVGYFGTPSFLGNLDLANRSIFEEESLPEEWVPGTYNANENIYATYAMIDQQIGKKLSLIGGLRYEATQIDYTGNLYNLDEETFSEDSRSNSYGNFLPSLHLNYYGNKNTILRFAWTNTLARPNYYDLVPYANFSPQDLELQRGNPELKASTSMNFDFMAEKYYENVGLISVGAFSKSINNFIYTQTLQNFSDPQFGSDLQYTLPRNGGSATVYGAEASFQKQIWKGLGIYLNYTFTQSSTSGIEDRENESISLPGTAEHMFNSSLSYETKKLVLRASLNYASDYIDELGGNSFEDRYYDRQLFLDVNASYAFTPYLRIYMEGNNLTNQPLRYYQGIADRTMQLEYYNARYNFGLKLDITK